jgi:hypothetical protein
MKREEARGKSRPVAWIALVTKPPLPRWVAALRGSARSRRRRCLGRRSTERGVPGKSNEAKVGLVTTRALPSCGDPSRIRCVLAATTPGTRGGPRSPCRAGCSGRRRTLRVGADVLRRVERLEAERSACCATLTSRTGSMHCPAVLHITPNPFASFLGGVPAGGGKRRGRSARWRPVRRHRGGGERSGGPGGGVLAQADCRAEQEQ